MRKLILIVIGVIIPILAIAEEYNIGTYTNASNGKSYAVDVRLKNGKIDLVYIFLATQSGVTGYFNFKGKDLPAFYCSLREMRNKYCEWSDTAIENSVTSFTKEFGFELPKGNLFWIGNETWMAAHKRLTPVFAVANSKPMFMLIGSADAMQNKYISETFSLVLIDLMSYDNFIQIFNPETALKKALENQSLTDKFK